MVPIGCPETSARNCVTSKKIADHFKLYFFGPFTVLFSYARPVLTKPYVLKARKLSAFIDLGSSSACSQKHSLGMYSNSVARASSDIGLTAALL